MLAHLDFSSRENSLKSDGAIEIWITKRFGNGEDDYYFLSMNIHNENWVASFISKIVFDGKEYFSLTGTDNTPSNICYNFSLQYLRLRPDHLISIYDIIFSLSDIEKIEKTTGYIENWLQKINLGKY